MNKSNEQFNLVGHLQVTDTPLLSLYVDVETSFLYFFLRACEEDYILKKIDPNVVIDYMDCKVGLSSIFGTEGCYMFHKTKKRPLSSTYFTLISEGEIKQKMAPFKMFDIYDDMFGYDEVIARHYISDKYKLVHL
ncbi:MAG: hypothetical protein MJY88_03420 [Bacteroidales bacterium]|nr:hypothetical protein [Bacteroidales bacterium]